MTDYSDSSFVWIETLLTDCPFENFHKVYDYWDQMRGDRFAPSWADLDLLALEPTMITHVCVVDVPEDHPPFPYRFFGTSLTMLHDLELSGKTTAIIKPDKYRAVCEDQYCKIIKARSPALFAGKIETESGIVREHFHLRMPLSDDARSVTNIITIEKFDEEVPELKDYYSSFNQ